MANSFGTAKIFGYLKNIRSFILGFKFEIGRDTIVRSVSSVLTSIFKLSALETWKKIRRSFRPIFSFIRNTYIKQNEIVTLGLLVGKM